MCVLKQLAWMLFFKFFSSELGGIFAMTQVAKPVKIRCQSPCLECKNFAKESDWDFDSNKTFSILLDIRLIVRFHKSDCCFNAMK